MQSHRFLRLKQKVRTFKLLLNIFNFMLFYFKQVVLELSLIILKVFGNNLNTLYKVFIAKNLLRFA